MSGKEKNIMGLASDFEVTSDVEAADPCGAKDNVVIQHGVFGGGAMKRLAVASLAILLLFLAMMVCVAWQGARHDILTARDFRLPGCHCSRVQHTRSPGPPGVNSRCSDHATAHGANQSVVSYALYGLTNGTDAHSVKKRKDYFWDYIPEIAQQVARMYPGYYLRLHMDSRSFYVSGVHSKLCSLFCDNDFFDVCLVDALPDPQFFNPEKQPNGMIWRALPTVDDLVAVHLSRDADNNILQREADAVAVWLASNYTLHLMRDHPWHAATIMGGMWGVKVSPRLYPVFREYLFSMTGNDQRGLNRIVFPKLFAQALSHDSYLCKDGQKGFGNEAWRPYPTQRSTRLPKYSQHIGVGIRFAHVPFPKCPRRCRPPEHQDWEYC
eukprot:GEMP01038148.1.p1 GENE.GEMP01038148.1~~GEMP01038148.1.p1  ORF type:complete len:381 (+),score=64.18 GEMP01038148.1:95-1237(+)